MKVAAVKGGAGMEYIGDCSGENEGHLQSRG